MVSWRLISARERHRDLRSRLECCSEARKRYGLCSGALLEECAAMMRDGFLRKRQHRHRRQQPAASSGAMSSNFAFSDAARA